MTIDPTVVVAAISALAAGIGAIARMVYRDLKADRDYWRDIAMTTVRHTDKAMDIASKKSSDV